MKNRMILSVIINAWSGSDLYRFRLQLETFLYRTAEPSNYLELCRTLLDSWERDSFAIPSDAFRKTFESLSFERVLPSADDVEFILAVDDSANGRAEAVERTFKEWITTNGLNGFIVGGAKLGVAAMRNIGIQRCSGDFVVFRDDDDFSTAIVNLIEQCRQLKKLHFGENKPYSLPTEHYNHVLEHRSRLLKLQRYPTIAILEDGYRLKNTWGSVSNPFSKTPTPIDVTTIELVDRPSTTSMCSKIFSRESLRMIYNSAACNSLEDARSHFLQQLPQNCIWLFSDERMRWLRDEWSEFKHSNGRSGRDGVRWLNLNVLNYSQWQIHFDEPASKRWENLDELMMNSFIVKSYDGPSFCYVLPSNSYGLSSWSYCSIVGVLEAFRNSHRSVEFTVSDLQRLKDVIESSISTQLINTNCITRVRWLGNASEKGELLAQTLERINNYRYIYWYGVVNRKDDWRVLEREVDQIRTLVNSLHSTVNSKTDGTDAVRDTPVHPNQMISLDRNYCISGIACKPIEETDSMNYTDWNNNQDHHSLMHGGCSSNRCHPPTNGMTVPIFILLLLFVVVLLIVLKMNGDAVRSQLRRCLSLQSFNDESNNSSE